MAQNDPEVIDVDYWLDLFRKTHTDAVTLAAGGYMAYYPSKVPYHYHSPSLKPGQDLFGTLVAGCRKLGMKYIFARTDGHAIHKSIAAEKPQWVTMHLVNLTNPMAMAGNIREIFPIGPLQVVVRPPEGTRHRDIRLLKAGRAPAVSATPAGLKIEVPSVAIHEVVAIDLEQIDK